MIELLVVVGIIGVLAAIAIPAYNTYQDNARVGVVSSIVELAGRTVAIEESLGKDTNNLTIGALWPKVKSKSKADFTPSYDGASGNWCVEVQGKPSGSYSDFSGCIDNADSSAKIGGNSIPCDSANYTPPVPGSPGTPAITCPGSCTAPTGGSAGPCGGGSYTATASCATQDCQL